MNTICDRQRIWFGYRHKTPTDVIVFPRYETVFARLDLYLRENADLSEESDETVHSAIIIPTISFPLSILNSSWQGQGYFLYQEEVSADLFDYRVDATGRIESWRANDSTHLDNDGLGEMPFAELEAFLEEQRQENGGYIRLYEDRYDIPPPTRSAMASDHEYELDYRAWQDQFYQHQFPHKPAYRDAGRSVLSLGNYPRWIQSGWHDLTNSQNQPMEYLGCIYNYSVELIATFSFLFYSPQTGEFTQIDQMT